MDVGGTVLASSNHVTGEASPVFLTVRLESGETVQASVNGKIDYRPGRRAILIETTAIFSASGNMSSKNISMSPPGNHLEERISFHVVD
jgi:hypothetical protein